MIVRIWHTQVDETHLDDYTAFEQNHSLPMFKQLAGCLGVFFIRTENEWFDLCIRFYELCYTAKLAEIK